MDNQETYEKIEAYLGGKMDAESRAAFERELASNPKLRELLALHHHLERSLADEGAQKLAATLKQVDNERFGKSAAETPVLRPSWGRYAMAAAVALLVVVGGYFLFQSLQDPQLTNQEIFAQNFEPYPSYFTLRSNVSRDSLLQVAFDAYSAKNYQKALTGFESALADSSSDTRTRFYMAMCYIGLNKPLKADPLLAKVISEKENPFRDPARWYKGLSLLQQNREKEAREVFLELSKGEGKYARQAKEILKSL
ncbi:MAG: hypothetical protein H6581_12645 [Bacteroidia bacterium]|nr:hypothetical protein [Bacteroidia bacterium]